MDVSLRLDSVETETKATIKRLQKICSSAGLRLTSYKHSAITTWDYGVIQFDGWHGTGHWGRSKLLLTLYPIRHEPSTHFNIGRHEHIDYDREGHGYFPNKVARQEYLRNLEKTVEIVEKLLGER